MQNICVYDSKGDQHCFEDTTITVQSNCQLVLKPNKAITKRQAGIIMISMIGIALAFSGMHLFTAIGTSFNASSLNLGQYETELTMQYNDGNINHPTTTLVISITPDPDTDTSTYQITIGSDVYVFECEYLTGYVKGTTCYPFFWIYLDNNLLNGHLADGSEISVYDPIGLLGNINTEYTMVSQHKLVYWTEEPKMIGSQLSFKFILYDDQGDAQYVGITDVTSGLLMTLEGKISLTTIDPGDFPISRHRNTGFPIVLASIIVIPLFALVWKKDTEMAILLFLGTLCTATDIYFDIWMVGWFGSIGLVILHLVLIVLLYFLGFARYKIGGHWIVPAVVELAFLLFFNLYTGEGTFVPYISVITGSLFGFILLTVHVLIGKKYQTIDYECNLL